MKYGYARVSTAAQATKFGLEAQREQLLAAGAETIYSDAYTGTKASRPEWDKLLYVLQPEDELIVCKLDRIARSAVNGIEVVDNLLCNGIVVNILNIGRLDNTATGKLIRNIMFSFAEFERDMIVTRTQEGKAIAKQNPDFREGRPHKYSSKQMAHALELLQGGKSYKQVSDVTGISISTLTRERRKQKASGQLW